MKRIVERFRRRVRAAIQTSHLEDEQAKALVAASGGPDSTALLDALAAITPELNMSLLVFHVDHGLRGKESDADRRAVAAQAKALYLPFKYRRLEGLNPKTVSEDRLRHLRYEALELAAKKEKCGIIFLGHHADDLAETLIMRLARGAGAEGLAGFGVVEPRNGLLLVRPMINMHRGEILKYLQARGIEAREDSSNLDLRFKRNRVRNEILPILAATLNPRIHESLARTARLLAIDADCLNAMASQEIANRVRWSEAVRLSAILDIEDWESVHEAIRTRILREILGQMGDQESAPYSRHIAALEHLSTGGRTSNFVVTAGNIVAYRRKKELLFFRMAKGRPSRQEVEKMVEAAF